MRFYYQIPQIFPENHVQNKVEIILERDFKDKKAGEEFSKI